MSFFVGIFRRIFFNFFAVAALEKSKISPIIIFSRVVCGCHGHRGLSVASHVTSGRSRELVNVVAPMKTALVPTERRGNAICR